MTAFLKQYLLHPHSVGAVAPSGRGLARKMAQPVDFAHASLIIEYGPGTGAFTRELLSRKRADTRLVLIERNDEFYRDIKARFDGKDNTTVLHGGAEEADRLVEALGFSHADAVVCGLPFASLPKTVSTAVFRATRRLIGDDGVFITFQYTMLKKKMFQRHFRITDCLLEWLNLPPAFVLVMRRRETRARSV